MEQFKEYLVQISDEIIEQADFYVCVGTQVHDWSGKKKQES